MQTIASMPVNINIVIAYILGIILIFIIGKILLIPFKIIMKFIYNALIGIILLWIFNYIGTYFDFKIEYNSINALIAGLFGVPGIILLAFIKICFQI